MPGVRITTETVSGPSARTRAPAATYFVVGQAERGDTTDPVEVRSLAEYERRFGGRVTYGALWDDLRTFFGEGGGRAYVARVVGPAAVLATVTLPDRAGVPVNTLRADAKNAGPWANDVDVVVANGVAANTFDLTVRYGDVEETFRGLTSPADAASKVSGGSAYINLVDLGSATAAPNNNPAVGTYSLAGGTDDRAAITGATYTAALARFHDGLGAGAVAIPGQPASAVGADLGTHAQEHQRIALTAPAAAVTPTAAETAARDLQAALTADERAHVGMFYPHVRVSAGGGLTRTISPEGYVAGVRARAHETVGPWQAPAGDRAAARFVLGVEREVTDAEGDSLDVAYVSAIRPYNGAELYGWRSLSLDEDNYRLLTGREVLNYLVHEAMGLLEPYVFSTIDGAGHLFSQLQGDLTGLVEPLRAAGGLYERRDADGDVLDPGYRVDTGPSVNTTDTAALGEVRARLDVRVSPTGELVSLTIAKVGVTAAL